MIQIPYRIILALLPLCFLVSCRQDPHVAPALYACHASEADSSAFHPNNARYTSLLDGMTASGVPGVLMSVREPGQPAWVGASGMADLNGSVPLMPCNSTRVGSTVKTYTAVTVLKLKEEGKLRLDDPITQYLGADLLKDIENAPRATIRQLLQHSSGIFNYIQDLRFQTASLNNLVKVWQPNDLLAYARNRKAYFRPGANVRYSNTNYVLLGMIIEKVEGKPFYKVFEDKIIAPLGLTATRFAAPDPVPAGIIRGYVDFYSNLNLIDATRYSGWDYYTADGGLISNPQDMTSFMQALFEGHLLSPETLQEMLAWKTPASSDPEFFKMHYGLGIFRMETPFGDAYVHSGDAIGYFATMMYFPEKEVALAWAVNGNYGKIDQFTSSKKAMDRIFGQVLRP